MTTKTVERPAEEHTEHPHIVTDYPLKPTLLLVAGDVIIFLIFSALGRSSHDRPPGAIPFSGVVSTAAPFILGWLIVALVLGAFKKAAVRDIRSAFLKAEGTWLIAGPVGLGLRALFLQRGVPLSFAIVVMTTNFILLGLWRSLFAWLRSR